MYKLDIKIPGLPKRINSTYARHWSVKYKESQTWVRLVGSFVRFNFPETPLKKANIYLTRGSASSPDFDGLVSSFKHVVDALVKLNIIEDDNMDVIGQPTYKWEKTKRNEGFVRIVVEEITDKCNDLEGTL